MPDYEYGYGDALADRRRRATGLLPGHERADGVERARRHGPLGDVRRPARRGRARASGCAPRCRSRASGCRPCCARRNERLVEVRREQPDAGGLVIATDQEHARGIAALLRARLGVTARRRHLRRPGRLGARSRASRTSSEPWLVAVRMVSEGVDIPRLRVGVYATTTTTELFFRQAVGRLVRWTRGVPRQRAWLFIPDDPRLRAHAAGIAEQRRHSLRRRRARASSSASGWRRSPLPARPSSCRSSPSSPPLPPCRRPQASASQASAEATHVLDEVDDGGGRPRRAGARAAAAAPRRGRDGRSRRDAPRGEASSSATPTPASRASSPAGPGSRMPR